MNNNNNNIKPLIKWGSVIKCNTLLLPETKRE